MKSAKMRMGQVVAGGAVWLLCLCLCLWLTGCASFDLGFGNTPSSKANESNARQAPVNQVEGDTVVSAKGARNERTTTADADDADSANTNNADPQVAALMQRINSIADRPNPSSSSNPGSQVPPNAANRTVVDNTSAKPSAQRTAATPNPKNSSAATPVTTPAASTGGTAISLPRNDATAGDTVSAGNTVLVGNTRTSPSTSSTSGGSLAAMRVSDVADVEVEIVDIRPVVEPVRVAADVKSEANQPADRSAAADLKDFIAQFEQDLKQRPAHPDDALRLRLMYLAAGQDEKAVAPIQGMDPVQTELLSAIVQVVAASRQAMLNPAEANPTALAAAEDLRRLISQQSGVMIPRIALVTKITSYGDYETISPARFKVGSKIDAYVYTEVGNFRSEPTEGDRLRTWLAEKVQVFDSTGQIVWEHEEKNIEDRVRSPRRDFFIPFPVHLPAGLAAGDYVIKVTIEDRIGNTTDQQRLSFSIQ